MSKTHPFTQQVAAMTAATAGYAPPHGKGTRVTRELREKIREALIAGGTYKKITQTLRVSRATVAREAAATRQLRQGRHATWCSLRCPPVDGALVLLATQGERLVLGRYIAGQFMDMAGQHPLPGAIRWTPIPEHPYVQERARHTVRFLHVQRCAQDQSFRYWFDVDGEKYAVAEYARTTRVLTSDEQVVRNRDTIDMVRRLCVVTGAMRLQRDAA